MSRRPRGPALALACTALAGLGLACSEGAEPAGPGLQGAVFILLDTVRADRVSTSGSARRTTPNLELLAERGVVFDQAISYSPWTLPSLVATLSGSWGNRPGVFRGGRLEGSLVEAIRDAGFATAAVTEGAFVSRDFGFDLGFEDYHEEEGRVQRLLPGEEHDERASGSVEATFAWGARWLREHARERFFLFVHTYEPHAPYRRQSFTAGLQPGAVGESFETEALPLLRSGKLRFDADELRYLGALYDGGILESDRQIGKLLAVLQELGLSEKTLIVVSSDHGEALGEHDPAGTGDHGHSLYDELLRVPLLMANPVEDYPVRRVAAQVRTIDVLPTIADLLGVSRARLGSGDGSPDGRSLVPLMRGEESGDRIAFGGATRVLPARAFVRSDGYKYIETRAGSPLDPKRRAPPPRQLYDLLSDSGELVNLVDREPELADRLAQQLREHLELQRGAEPTPTREAIPEGLRSRLESLGYLE